tara:strand:+ start:82 stop:489 length:408 start_codon:yes stop_codon:yes gene_type:complete
MNYTVEEVNLITQQGFGPSPAESQMIIDEANKQRAIDAERARLAVVESQARQAGEEYYAEGGTGYGTVPGGPDVTYMPSDAPGPAKFLYPVLDPIYGESGLLSPITDIVTGEGGARNNLLLYGALAIGALALLKK